MSVKEFTFEIDELTFTGLRNDNPSGPVLLCLHGFLDNAASFRPLIPLLDDYQVIALDLAGHGAAAHRPKGYAYHLTDYVYDVATFVKAYLTHTHQSKVLLVGHSLGGIVGSVFTACYPELVNAFVTIEACGPLSQDEESSVAQLRDSFESRDVSQSTAVDKRTMQTLISARCKISDFDEKSARTILERNCKEVDGGVEWQSDKALRTKSPLRMTEAQACNILANITSPTMLMLGDKGFDKIKANLKKRVEFMQSLIDVKEISGGHHLHMQSPQDVASAVKPFFDNFSEYSIS